MIIASRSCGDIYDGFSPPGFICMYAFNSSSDGSLGWICVHRYMYFLLLDSILGTRTPSHFLI